MKDLANKLHPLERAVVPYLKDGISFESLSEKSKLKKVEVMRALQWLENKKVLKIKTKEKEFIELDKNGLLYKEKGLPEIRFLKALDKTYTLSELGKKTHLNHNELSISIGFLKKHSAINVQKKKELEITITDRGKTLLKGTQEQKFLNKKFPLEKNKVDSALLKSLLQRKQIIKLDKKKQISVALTELGKKLSKIKLSENVDKLTQKMLKDGSWKNKEFRRYDVEINVPKISGGKRHFTNQVVEYIKSIWLDSGFKEMTGNIVQTGFWDLDALFVPQDHPAREMQDTFYLKNPQYGKLPKKALVERVKKTHEDGWTTGSLGYRNKWSEDIAKENLLRTHTTVLSATTISKLKKEDLPAKFFSVGKCFRNEALDWKHLFEFYQVEGIVVDPEANFRNLIGYLKEFFRKMGYPDVRVRPGHFPYTEPSAEVEVFHPKRKEWVELGGSGVFRPELSKPLLGFECPVLAWGLSLGRLILEYWKLTDLRDLYKNDLKQLRDLKVWLK
jgi:phenylalanyl-tRNA synthetase alpha chain